MTKDEALRLALDALENLAHYADTYELFLKETHPGKADALRQRVTNSIETITAIKTALEAKDEIMEFFDWYDNAHWGNEDFKEGCHRAWNASIKAREATLKPQADELTIAYMDGLSQGKKNREWVGLTDDEVSKIIDKVIGFNSCAGWEEEFARAIEAKLRSKNTQ